MDLETLARIEGQRIALEANIAKLRTSLRHWQTLEVEYEGLKEEFLALPESSTAEECFQAAQSFQPKLIDERELGDIVSNKKPSQLVELLTKRTDYVSRNSETLRNQLSTAQKQWNALVLAEGPEHREEAALPLKEIIEELDDDGNIVSTTVKAPGGETADLVDVLRQAGVPDLPEGRSQTRDEKISSEDEAEISSVNIQPTNPDDTEEEAELRQEMLHYGLGEVGQIVAELELEQDLADDSSDDYTEEESEDERGATKNPIISDDYRKKMEALEEKLGIRNLGSVGPQPEIAQDESVDRPPATEAARKAAIARYEATKKDDVLKRNRSGTKKVAFADELDIAPKVGQPEVVGQERKSSTPTPPAKMFADILVERPASNKASAPDPLDFDEELHRREVATGFQKLRNRKIHDQGGYVGGGEQDNYGDDVVMETMEDGKPKRVSRFKAARLRS